MVNLSRRSVRAVSAGLGLLLLCAGAARAWDIRPRVIYGPDDRRDYYLLDPGRAALADSTVALFSGVRRGQNGWAALPLEHYGRGMGLCDDEPFFDQPMGAFCSGSLVGPDLVLTAGHCVESQAQCRQIDFVFGYAMRQENAVPAFVPETDVYRCDVVVDRRLDQHGDWALIKLDRTVYGRQPLPVNWTGQISNGVQLVVVGYPAGLPVKAADNAWVRNAAPPGYFEANLDTYGGNSGSAVFNVGTGLIEGVLVRGDTDYVPRGACRVSNRCADGGCGGEAVTKISLVLPRLREELARRNTVAGF